MYIKDLRATSDEAYQTPCGAQARSMQSVTAEVAGMNTIVAKLITGDASGMPSDAEREAFTASLADREVAAQMMSKSADMLAGAIESAGGERLATMTEAPWGEPMSYYALANIAANHILYHDGQLNLVQCLHGDDKMHWFDEEPSANV